MHGVSTFRLHLLRAMYLLIAVGLGLEIWPGALNPPEELEHMRGVVRSLLAAVSLMAVVGLRYPLQMLPLLLFELVLTNHVRQPGDRWGRRSASAMMSGGSSVSARTPVA